MNFRAKMSLDQLLGRILRSGGKRDLFRDDRRAQRHRILTIAAITIGMGSILVGLFSSHQADANRQVPAPADGTRVTVSLPLPGSGGAQPPSTASLIPAKAAPGVASIPSSADEPGVAELAPTAAGTASESAKEDEPALWHEVTVKSGDTLAGIFNSQGLDARTMYKVLALGDSVSTLKRIFPGQVLRFRVDGEGHLQELAYQESVTRSLRVVRSGDEYRAEAKERQFEVRLAHANGTITDSLYLSAQRAGLSDALIMELAGIFGWDVDFALDIRQGDRFSLLYQELYLDGQKVKDGDILATQFVNQGKSFQAVRYTDAEQHTDYYTPEGLSMRKAFLRAPVDFRRISSRFTKERWHPVLGKKRPHRGVDYAAKTGTPIWASGDGKVLFAGWKGGYGNAVILKHGDTYSTLYGHMSRIAKGIRPGARVRQGQTIGYVGMTGLATGPHLHYEFRVNGVHRNPLTVKLPAALPIQKKYRQDFLAHAQQVMAKLDTYDQQSTVAKNEP